MKKTFALILILLCLLTSCTTTKNSNEITSPETTLPETQAPEIPAVSFVEKKYFFQMAELLIITNGYPEMVGLDQFPMLSKYMVNPDGTLCTALENLENSTEYTEYKVNIQLKIYDYEKMEITYKTIDADRSYIIHEGSGDNTIFQRYFPSEFFENNVILFLEIPEIIPDSPYFVFEYAFDKDTKTLKVQFSEVNHSGWSYCTTAVLHQFCYFISIPKSALKVNGEIPPYEEITVDVSGTYVTDP